MNDDVLKEERLERKRKDEEREMVGATLGRKRKITGKKN